MEPTTDCRISRMLDIFFSWGVPKGMTKTAKREAVKRIREEVRELSEAIDNNDDVAALDAICDIQVISADYAYRCGYDLENAVDEVNNSNATKTLYGEDVLNNCQDSLDALAAKGKQDLRVVRADYGDLEDSEDFLATGSIIDKQGKVQKPLTFAEPDLTLFVGEPNE